MYWSPLIFIVQWLYFAFYITRGPIWMTSFFVCFALNLSSMTHRFHALWFGCGLMTSLIGYITACLHKPQIALNNSTQRKKSKRGYPHGRDKDFPPAFSQEMTGQNDLNRHAKTSLCSHPELLGEDVAQGSIHLICMMNNTNKSLEYIFVNLSMLMFIDCVCFVPTS